MNASADHEAYLRAALHAAAESLDPRGDGLERIQERLRHPRPRVVVWLVAAWDEIRFRSPAVLQQGIYRLAAEFRAAWDRFSPVQAPGKHRSRTQGWLRPLTAMTAVMFIVAAGTYVAIDASTAVSPSSSSSHQHSGTSHPGSHHNGGGAGGQSQVGSSAGVGSGVRNPSPSPSCSSKPKPTPGPSTTVPTSPTPNPSTTSPSSPPAPSSPAPSDSTGDASSPDGATSAIQLTAYLSVASTQRQTAATPACATPSAKSSTP